MEEKKCKRCDRILPVEMFNKKTTSKDGLQQYCRECQTLIAKEARAKKESSSLQKVYSNPELAKFKPRDLIEELRARGYSGELTYIQRIAL